MTHLLVTVEVIAVLGGEGGSNRDGLRESDEGADQGVREDFARVAEVETMRRRGWHACRHLLDLEARENRGLTEGSQQFNRGLPEDDKGLTMGS